MEFTYQNVILRTVTNADIHELARTWPDEHRPISAENAAREISRMAENHSKNTPGSIKHLCLAVCKPTSPQVIMGWCGLDGSKISSEPEIFVLLDREYQNQGFGSQCVEALLKIAVHTFNLHRIHGGCFKDNLASARIMEKAGMILCGQEINGDLRYLFDKF